MHQLPRRLPRRLFVVALSLSLATAASANTKSDHDRTMDHFFRCGQVTNLWHAIATGNWPFFCWSWES